MHGSAIHIPTRRIVRFSDNKLVLELSADKIANKAIDMALSNVVMFMTLPLAADKAFEQGLPNYQALVG